MLLLLIVFLVLVSSVVRLLTAPFRNGRRYHRGFGSPYGYGYGCRRHRFGGGLLPVLGLLALARIFGRRF